jgi:hypothetical protein
MSRPFWIPPLVQVELDGCPLPWRIRDDGGKHTKLIVGEKMAGILPRVRSRDDGGIAAKNVRSQIRRIVRELSA